MKITTFDPFIATAHVDETIEMLEELGFERRHTKEGIEIAGRDNTVFRMKDENGYYLDILQIDGDDQRDSVGIRMNVDDFDEAYQILKEKGFKNVYDDEIVETETSKAAMMISSSGYMISVIQHKQEK